MEFVPEELLFDIFGRLPSQDLRLTVPLVCKSWHDIVSEPSSLWHDITVDLHYQSPPLRSSLQSFFKKRREQLRSLHVVLPASQAGIAADILEALGNEPPLKRFSINFGGAQAAAIPTLLPQLSWLRNLKALRISGLQGPLTPIQLHGLRHLHHLRAFELSLATDTGAPQLPGGFPVGLLPCTKLEALHISCAGEYSFRILPSCLSRLQNLLEMGFVRCGAHGFCPGFAAMTNLTSLVVIDPSPPRHMKFPRDLSAMERLCSVDVGCREIPLPLGTLPNLQHLTLRGLRPSCRGSHDPERDFAQLFEKLSLKSLSLLSCRLGSVPNATTYHCSLESLIIRDCYLTYLASGPYLSQLRQLDLCGNEFCTVPLEALSAPYLETLYMIAIADGADGAAPIDVAEWREKRQKDGRTPAMEMLTELEDITRQLSNLRMETRLRRDDDLHSSSILPIQSTSLDST